MHRVFGLSHLNVNSGYVINSISLDGEQIANDITSNYYVNPSALYDGCTLIVQASERPKTNVTIYGDPSQIKVAYMYQTYDESSWDAGTLSITLQDPYSSVTISARDGFGLQGVNVNGNNELQPGSRTFTLYPSTLKPGDNRVEVSSYSMADERSSHFTVIVNGDPASVSLRLAGDSYDITGDALNAPIAFNPDFDLPIRIEPNIYGHTFYRVMADGTEIIPSDGSYKIAELADNGVITIDADYPDKDIPVRLSFVNPDTGIWPATGVRTAAVRLWSATGVRTAPDVYGMGRADHGIVLSAIWHSSHYKGFPGKFALGRRSRGRGLGCKPCGAHMEHSGCRPRIGILDCIYYNDYSII